MKIYKTVQEIYNTDTYDLINNLKIVNNICYIDNKQLDLNIEMEFTQLSDYLHYLKSVDSYLEIVEYIDKFIFYLGSRCTMIIYKTKA